MCCLWDIYIYIYTGCYVGVGDICSLELGVCWFRDGVCLFNVLCLLFVDMVDSVISLMSWVKMVLTEFSGYNHSFSKLGLTLENIDNSF